MKPEDMNTINDDGKAYDGRRGPVVLALSFIACVSLLVAVAAVRSWGG
ncbi:hypothetical protein [Shinella zoogloeoides]|nr:hypothetical protein [Shinella zoogloeoides]WPE19929.1 hypothetical protein ShzoTeo12_11070 [Shinella zoogloeoides]